MSFIATLGEALKARPPLVYVETSEEVRAIGSVTDAAAAQRTPRSVWTWTNTLGLVDGDGKAVANTTNPARPATRLRCA